ncbi:MAG: DMT family transporter [Xanthomonadales bacterium]|nr:DMT family transporter [Xanthomonadales bacterium]
MPHAIIHIIKGQPQGAAQTPGETNEALGLLAFCWLLAASVFIAVKWAGTYTPPWTLVFFRLLFATLFLLPFVASHFREMAARLRNHYWIIIPIGAFGLAFTQGALFTALHHSSVINVGIVFSVWPITAIILAAVFLGDRLTLLQIFGVILCFGGVLVVVARGNPDTFINMGVNTGDLLVLAAVLCFSFYTIMIKKVTIDLAALPLLVLLLGSATLASAPFFAWEIFHDARIRVDWHDIAAIAYIAIPGGGIMYLLFNTGIAMLGAAKASVTFYLQTLFTVILAYFLLGEQLHIYHAVGIALIAIGIIIVTLIKPGSKSRR